MNGLVILAVICFLVAVVLTPIKLRQSLKDRKPRLLPSTFFTCGATLAASALLTTTHAGEHVLMWGGVTALSSGFLGAVASLFSVPILPRWQWLAQVVISLMVLLAVGVLLLA